MNADLFQTLLVIGVIVIAAATVLGAIIWHAHMKIFRIRFHANGKAHLQDIDAANIAEAVDKLRAVYPSAVITRAEKI